MKKFIIITMAALLTLSLAACANNKKPDEADDATKAPITNTEAPTEEPEQEQTSDQSALEIMDKIWASYSDEDKFPIFGGDTSEENLNPEGPGKYSLDDPAVMENALTFPAASIGKIDEAATLVHLMNSNTFTGAAYHLVNGGDADALASELENLITTRVWLCGAPQKLVIARVDNCLVVAYGTDDLVNGFVSHLTAEFDSAEIVCENDL